MVYTDRDRERDRDTTYIHTYRQTDRQTCTYIHNTYIHIESATRLGAKRKRRISVRFSRLWRFFVYIENYYLHRATRLRAKRERRRSVRLSRNWRSS